MNSWSFLSPSTPVVVMRGPSTVVRPGGGAVTTSRGVCAPSEYAAAGLTAVSPASNERNGDRLTS